MFIEKDSILIIKHSRHGNFIVKAITDFDPKKVEFLPVILAQPAPVEWRKAIWREGDKIPCRALFCHISDVIKPKKKMTKS